MTKTDIGVLHFDPSKFDAISGDPVDDDGIPWPKRPGTEWEPVRVSLTHSALVCQNCRGDYNDHGSSKNRLLCHAPKSEWDRYNRARAMRAFDGVFNVIKNDLIKLSDEQRGDLFHKLRDVFCLKCGTHITEQACKCPRAERC